MSIEKNNIDELFRSKLGDYSLEAPEHVWKAIEARRTPLYRAINYFKSRNGVAVLGALLLLVSISSVALWHTADDVSQQNQVVQTTPAKNTNTPIQAANNNGGENSEDVSIQNELVTGSTAQFAQNGVTAQSTSTPQSSVPNSTATPTQNNGNSATPPVSTNGNNEGNIPPTSVNSPNGNTTTPNQPNANTNKPEQNIEETLLTDDNKTNPLPQGGEPKHEEILATGRDLENADTEGANKTEEENKNRAQQNATIKPIYMLGKYTFDLYGGIDFAGRSLSSNGAPQSYIQAKQNAESFKVGKTLGFRINYDATKYLTVRAGLQYTQLGEKLNFENKYNYTRIDTNIGVILDPRTQQPIGSPITTIDTINGTTTAKANAVNTISFIDVPVQLEWKLIKTNKFSVFATTGAAFNLRFQQDGYQINTQLDGIHQLNTNTTPYKTTAGFTLMGGVGINYQLSPRYSVLFETTYRQGINSVMKSEAGMQQTYRIFSGSFGLRYRF